MLKTRKQAQSNTYRQCVAGGRNVFTSLPFCFEVNVQSPIRNYPLLAAVNCASSRFAFFLWEACQNLGELNILLCWRACQAQRCVRFPTRKVRPLGGRAIFWNDPYCLSMLSDRLKQLSVSPLSMLFKCLAFHERHKICRQWGKKMLKEWYFFLCKEVLGFLF